jgi:hypothetical protein
MRRTGKSCHVFPLKGRNAYENACCGAGRNMIFFRAQGRDAQCSRVLLFATFCLGLLQAAVPSQKTVTSTVQREVTCGCASRAAQG